MRSALQIVDGTFRNLPPAERLCLAALVQDHLTGVEVLSVDVSDFWTEQDQRDLAAFSLAYADTV